MYDEYVDTLGPPLAYYRASLEKWMEKNLGILIVELQFY